MLTGVVPLSLDPRHCKRSEMESLVKRLPSPSALLTFEAAARHLSFTRAAQELNVTQAAVSRQIRNLESRLGVRLFERGHRAVTLTAPGQNLHGAVTMGLEHIARSVAEVERAGRARERDVSIAATNAVAAFWLMPRLTTFRATNPDVSIRVVSQDSMPDLGGDGADIAIRYGDGRWPGVAARRLFDDEIYPVCSPAFAETRPNLATPQDLLQQPLLALDVAEPIWIDWDTWFEQQGLDKALSKNRLRFNNYTILIQASLEGQGIALGWSRLVADLVDRGHLVRPIGASIPSRHSYYLVWPERMPLERPVRRLRNWILREAGQRA
jgi:LysR family glycine cleavage system transcriptional activator